MAQSAAILDIDGTLVDTNYQHAIAWFRAFRAQGMILPVWRIHRHIGMGGDQLVPALAGEEFADLHGDDVRESEPDLVHAALEKVGADDGVMVGDTPWDVEAAGRAGIETLAVLTGGVAASELRDAGTVEVFESVRELCERLGETVLA